MTPRASVGANNELSQVGHVDSTPILILELKIEDVVQIRPTNDINSCKKRDKKGEHGWMGKE